MKAERVRDAQSQHSGPRLHARKFVSVVRLGPQGAALHYFVAHHNTCDNLSFFLGGTGSSVRPGVPHGISSATMSEWDEYFRDPERAGTASLAYCSNAPIAMPMVCAACVTSRDEGSLFGWVGGPRKTGRIGDLCQQICQQMVFVELVCIHGFALGTSCVHTGYRVLAFRD